MPACSHAWNKVTGCCSECGISRVAYEAGLKRSLSCAEELVERLQKRVQTLTAELHWYGDEANHERVEVVVTEGRSTFAGFRSPIEEDKGRRARKATGA